MPAEMMAFVPQYGGFVCEPEVGRELSAHRIQSKKQNILITGGEPLPGELDEKICAQYICDPAAKLTHAGTAVGWRLYATRPYAVIFLQIWRQLDNNNYRLIGETLFEANAPGDFLIKLTDEEKFHVQEGDTIGFYYPECSVIPYEKIEGEGSKLLSYEKPAERVRYQVKDERLPFYEKPEVESEREFQAAPHVGEYRSYSLSVLVLI